eukprot:2254288-Rhodomonas_salina.1
MLQPRCSLLRIPSKGSSFQVARLLGVLCWSEVLYWAFCTGRRVCTLRLVPVAGARAEVTVPPRLSSLLSCRRALAPLATTSSCRARAHRSSLSRTFQPRGFSEEHRDGSCVSRFIVRIAAIHPEINLKYKKPHFSTILYQECGFLYLILGCAARIANASPACQNAHCQYHYTPKSNTRNRIPCTQRTENAAHSHGLCSTRCGRELKQQPAFAKDCAEVENVSRSRGFRKLSTPRVSSMSPASRFIDADNACGVLVAACLPLSCRARPARS